MFSSLPDPRASNTRHRLSDVMFIALAASLRGAQSAVDDAQFARSKRGLLESFLGPFEPPSHDTFSRLFRRLDPEAVGQALPASATSPKPTGKDPAGAHRRPKNFHPASHQKMRLGR